MSNNSHNIALAAVMFGSVYLNSIALQNLQETLTIHQNQNITKNLSLPLYISYTINGVIFVSTSTLLITVFTALGK